MLKKTFFACLALVSCLAFSQTSEERISQKLLDARQSSQSESFQKKTGSQIRAAENTPSSLTNERRRELMEQADRSATPSRLNMPMPAPGMTQPQRIDPTQAGLVDPAAIAQQYKQIQPTRLEKQIDDASEVMVFVSMSMPTASLERIAQDSKRAGVPVIMRGVNRGVGAKWKQSMDELKPLTNKGGKVTLNPDLFERYQIKRVPAVVVVADPAAGCTEVACKEFAVVYGDVTLDYALEQISDRKDTLGKIAKRTLAKLEHK